MSDNFITSSEALKRQTEKERAGKPAEKINPHVENLWKGIQKDMHKIY